MAETSKRSFEQPMDFDLGFSQVAVDCGSQLATGSPDYFRQLVTDHAELVPASYQLRSELHDEIVAAWSKAQKANWDGEDGLPVSKETLIQAIKFSNTLPFAIVQPDVQPYPDGCIVFEWTCKDGALISASIKEDETLAYAMYLDENDKDSAMRTFKGFGVPDFEKMLKKYASQ
jgi:hypothetical protein